MASAKTLLVLFGFIRLASTAGYANGEGNSSSVLSTAQGNSCVCNDSTVDIFDRRDPWLVAKLCQWKSQVVLEVLRYVIQHKYHTGDPRRGNVPFYPTPERKRYDKPKHGLR